MMKKLFAAVLLLMLLRVGLAEEAGPLTLRRDFTQSQGRVTVYWQDAGHGAPYTVNFMLADETLDEQAEFCQTGVMEKSCTLDYLVPGSAYRITVIDQFGNSDAMEIALPEAQPFQDGALTAKHISSGAAPRSRPVFWKTSEDIHSESRLYASEIIENMGVLEYGFRYFLGFPELKNTRVYHTQLVFRAPGGFVCSYYLGQVPYASGGAPAIKMYWSFIGSEFFEYLYEYTDSIPAGEYTIDCYWDGMAVTSASFEIL